MLNQEQIIILEGHLKSGLSKSEIAITMGLSLGTIYKYTNLLKYNISNSTEFDQKPIEVDKNEIINSTPHILKPYLDLIEEQIHRKIYNSSKIYQNLQLNGFTGSYGTVNNYIRQKEVKNNPQKYRAYQRIETEAGEQAQVDWGYIGKIKIEDRIFKLYVFVYTLSYSRMAYAEFMTSQKQRLLQECHMHAFERIGIPKKLRYDNMKTIVISRKKVNGKEIINYNFDFLNFAKYYKFEPEVCPPYYPRSKGKVESGVKYIKNSFMDGEKYKKTFLSINELNKKLWGWLEKIANQRVHGTTKERPVDRYLREKEHLFITDGYPRYQDNLFSSRRASQSSMVTYKNSAYWVPEFYARKKINISEVICDGITKIELYFRERRIAEYPLAQKSGSWILPKDFGSKEKRQNDKVKKHLIFSTEVESRDLDYYNQFIKK